MEIYLYLSLVPEALIYSMLPPEKFGKYLAIGDKKTTESPALFFEVDPDFRHEAFRLDQLKSDCHGHEDGSPRRSTYVSVYHALANIPVSALGRLHLATKAGFVLPLERGEYEGEPDGRFYLYQELCPVRPRVVSRLEPKAFNQHVTDPRQPIFLPRVVFCDLNLGTLETDPAKGDTGSLPYHEIRHLRECLMGLQEREDKMTKIAVRDMQPEILFASIRRGVFVGDQQSFAYYPLPDEDTLARDHHLWWHSARSVPRY